MHKTGFFAVLALLLSWQEILSPAPLSAGVIEEVERSIETKRLARLHQAQQGQQLADFSTDGCSGGLSTGWEFLANQFPKFRQQFSHSPPWQHCCVLHDRAYWRGETERGYELRQRADQALKNCVIQTGRDLAPKLSRRFGLTEKEVTNSFDIAGELMYRAVRLGGQPCSPFPWRWGYGWPKCALF